jgi:hypothetical protein
MGSDLQDPERVARTERLAGSGRIEQVSRYWRLGRRAWAAVRVLAVAVVAIALVIVALSVAHLLPKLKNPFAETTTVRSGPALLKSITALSRYEAASGSFQVVVDLSTRSSLLPSFIEGSQTLFVGSGTDIAFVDFSHLSGKAVVVSRNRSAVTIKLPAAQLEPAVLSVRRSYVFAEQQGVLNRIGNFFSTNPNSEQRVYQAAQHKIQLAAKGSPLIAQAEKNTTTMLTGLLHSLGFKQVTVTFNGIAGLGNCSHNCGLKH